MTNYQNTKIYKLYCPDGNPNDVYYGATIKTLERRLIKHKNSNDCLSRLLFEKYKDKVIIELVENFPCTNKKESGIREAYYIRNNNCINTVIPDRTKKEYYIEYYIEHKEQIAERKKEKITCECGKTYTRNNKSSHIKSQKHQQYITNLN